MCPVVCSQLLPAVAGSCESLDVFASVAAQVFWRLVGSVFVASLRGSFLAWMCRVCCLSLRAEGLDAPVFVAAGIAAWCRLFWLCGRPFAWEPLCVCWVAWGCFFLPCGALVVFCGCAWGLFVVLCPLVVCRGLPCAVRWCGCCLSAVELPFDSRTVNVGAGPVRPAGSRVAGPVLRVGVSFLVAP